MKRVLLIAAASAALAACETTAYGPPPPPPPPPTRMMPPPPPPPPQASPNAFHPEEFGWSKAPGRGQLQGTVSFRAGQTRYTCAASDVLLTPETPWSRRRMNILYGSSFSAAVPVALVRERSPSAPSGDYASFVRHAVCDGANHFSFAGLPDGAWYVITVAKPVGNPNGEKVAIMRRVETRTGLRGVILNGQ